MEEKQGNDVLDIVKELIAITFENNPDSERDPINKGIIQKQLYIAQSISLHFYDTPLYNDSIEAWKYGPVVSRVWYTFNDSEERHRLVSSIADRKVNAFEQFILEMTFALTKDMSFSQLVDLTHEEGGVWHRHYNAFEKRKAMPNKEIGELFIAHKTLLKRVEDYFSNYKSPFYEKNDKYIVNLSDKKDDEHVINAS